MENHPYKIDIYYNASQIIQEPSPLKQLDMVLNLIAYHEQRLIPRSSLRLLGQLIWLHPISLRQKISRLNTEAEIMLFANRLKFITQLGFICLETAKKIERHIHIRLRAIYGNSLPTQNHQELHTLSFKN